jgi:hypothetical protein
MPPRSRKRKANATSTKQQQQTNQSPPTNNWKHAVMDMTGFIPDLCDMVREWSRDRILVIGGFDSPHQLVDSWDPTSRRWTPLHNLLFGRYAASTFIDPQTQQLVVVGGRNRVNEVIRQAESFDVMTQQWTDVTDSYRQLCDALTDYSLFFPILSSSSSSSTGGEGATEGLLFCSPRHYPSHEPGILVRYSIVRDCVLERNTCYLPDAICNRGHHCMEYDPSRQCLWVLVLEKEELRLGYYDLQAGYWNTKQTNLYPPVPFRVSERAYFSLYMMPDRQSILVWGGLWPSIYHFDLVECKWSIWASKPVTDSWGANSDRYACGSMIIDQTTLVWIDYQHDWHQWDLQTRAYKLIPTHLSEERRRCFSTCIGL